MVQREVVEVGFKVFGAVYCHCGVGKSGSKNEGKHFLLELGMTVILKKESFFCRNVVFPINSRHFATMQMFCLLTMLKL